MNFEEYLKSMGYKCVNISYANKLLKMQRRDVVEIVRNLGGLGYEESSLQNTMFGTPKVDLIASILLEKSMLEII